MKTWLWLRGAQFVNPGKGPFAALIRDYTIAQYQLRYGEPPNPDQLNRASNKIAENFLGQWLGYNKTTGTFSDDLATQPTIGQAGLFDAGPAAAEVFNLDPGGANAAGWAGSLLFGNLGDADFWRKLIMPGLLNPTQHGEYRDPNSGNPSAPALVTADTGSYDAIAAAAALQEWGAGKAALGAAVTPSEWLEIINIVFAQAAYKATVQELMAETDSAFKSLYGLEGSDPSPKLGSDTLGFWSTASDIFKDAHYTVGSKIGDVIGYKAATNGAYATQTGFFQHLAGLTGMGEAGDVINAGRGDDTVYGTSGSDILDGGADTNTLIYTPASWSGALDRLYFSFDGKGKFSDRIAVDKWSLTGSVFGQQRDIAVQFAKLVIDYQQNQEAYFGSASGMTEVLDRDDAPRLTVDLSGVSSKVGSALKRSERVTIEGDLHKTRGANVYIDLGGSPQVAYHQDIIDASNVTHGVEIDLQGGRVKALDQWDISTSSKIYITNGNEAIGTRFDDKLIGSAGKKQEDAGGNVISGEGFSALYG
ncbi:MAG: hypothetical protein EOO38_13140, partial [Cytophagaceae bacterium]